MLREIDRQLMKEFIEKRKSGFKPTFYIGLGGFGCSVVRELKRRILDLWQDESGKVPSFFAFLGLDTHQRDPNDILTLNEYVELSWNVNPRQVVNSNQWDSRLFDWFRNIMGNSWVANYIHGAGMIRTIGRFSLLYPPTYSEVRKKVDSLFTQLNLPSEGAITKAKVYVISSLAGGTGSAILLDFLILLEKFLIRGNNAIKKAVIVALPEVWLEVVPYMYHYKIKSNAYAALKEIYHFMDDKNVEHVFILTEQGGQRYEEANNSILPPTIFVLGGTNEKGVRVAPKPEYLRNIIVSFLLGEIFAVFDPTQADVFSGENDMAVLNQICRNGAKRRFSSFGYVCFGYPYKESRDYFASKIIQHCISEELKIDSDYVEQLKTKFMEDNYLYEKEKDELQEYIRKTEGRDVSKRDITSLILNKFDNKDRSDLFSTAKNTFNRQLPNLIERLKEDILVKNRNELVKKLKENFDEVYQDILNKRPVKEVLDFLVSLKEAINVNKESLEKEKNDAEKMLSEIDKQVQDSMSEIDKAARSGFFGRKKRIKRALDNFSRIVNKYYSIKLKVLSMDLGIEVYNEVLGLIIDKIEYIRDLVEQMESLKNNLIKLNEEIRFKINKLARVEIKDEGNYLSIVDFDKVKSLYDEYFKDKIAAEIEEIRKKWRESEFSLFNETDALNIVRKSLRDVYPYVDGVFKQNGLNILTILNKFYDTDDKRRDLFNRKLEQFVSPLFEMDTGRALADYPYYWIIAASSNIRRSIVDLIEKYLGARSEGSVEADYPSEYEVVIYMLKLGYTIDSHRSLMDLKYAYDGVQGNYDPANGKYETSHCWFRAWDWEEPIPMGGVPEQESYQWFGIGLAFNWIFNKLADQTQDVNEKQTYKEWAGKFIYKNVTYYYLKDDQGTEIQLGQGVVNAWRRFRQDSNYIRWLENRVRRAFQTFGEKTFIDSGLLRSYLSILDQEIHKIPRGTLGKEREDVLKAIKRSYTEWIEQL